MYYQLLYATNILISKNNKNKDINTIKIEKDYTSNKEGFAYFNDLFVKRYMKVLADEILKQIAMIIITIAAVIYIVITNIFEKEFIIEYVINYLPYSIFILWCINRSQNATKIMFVNCDYSMLTYRFYKTPKVIISIFKERLKTLIKINIIPALLIGLGFDIIIYLTDGTSNYLNYLLIIIATILIAVFFCTYYLVGYYLLQPYNKEGKIESNIYVYINLATLIISYYSILIKMPIFNFCLITIIICMGFLLFSLLIVYKLAPKTFKIRT